MKSNPDDKKHYIVKFLPKDENSQRQPLSIWKRNVSNKKDRSLRKTSNNADQRSLSRTSKEDDYGTVQSLKQSLRTITMRNTKNTKTAWPSFISKDNEERTSSLPKARDGSGKDNLKNYLIKSLQSNLIKDSNKQATNIEDYYDSNIVSHAKQSLEDLDKYQEKGVQSLNELKQKSGRLANFYSGSKNHFLIKSMSNLDISSQYPSLSQVPSVSNININGENDKRFFTTHAIPTSPVRRVTIKKIIKG